MLLPFDNDYVMQVKDRTICQLLCSILKYRMQIFNVHVYDLQSLVMAVVQELWSLKVFAASDFF